MKRSRCGKKILNEKGAGCIIIHFKPEDEGEKYGVGRL